MKKVCILIIIMFVIVGCEKKDNNIELNKGNNNEISDNNENVIEDADWIKDDVPNVSKNWEEFKVSINGVEISLPCKLSDLLKIGNFIYDSYDKYDLNTVVEAKYSQKLDNIYDSNGNKIANVGIQNESNNSQKLSDCMVTSINQNSSYIERSNNYADFPIITYSGGLQVGMAITTKEIVNLLGEYDLNSKTNYFEYVYFYKDLDDTYISSENAYGYNYKISLAKGRIESLSTEKVCFYG